MAFWDRVEPDGDCLVWQGATWQINGKRYGKVHTQGTHRGVHCIAWEEVNGPLPPFQAVLRNVCGNTLCVRPTHWRRKDQPDRNAAIVSRYQSGARVSDLATEFGLSRMRIYQIMSRGAA